LARSSVLGRMPASDSLLALTKTMQRIGVSPFVSVRAGSYHALYSDVEDGWS
jgi:hypothetical protein